MNTNKQSNTQKRTVGRVMHEFKHGDLESSRGGKVKNPKQAIAIALSEAGASDRQSSAENRRRQTRRKERQGQASAASGGQESETRAALYQRARKAGIAGRSKMDRAELEKALRQHRA